MFERSEDTTEAVLNCNRVLVLIVCCVEDTVVGQSWIHQQMVSHFYNNFTVMLGNAYMEQCCYKTTTSLSPDSGGQGLALLILQS